MKKQGGEVFKSIKDGKTTQDKLQRILDGLTELETMVTKQKQAYQEHNEKPGKDGRNNDLIAITKRLISMEEWMVNPTQAQDPAVPGPRTWSQVASRAEQRMENMEGAEKETP